MNRLFEIVDFLRGRERTTTLELAAHLDVSERTVRRDLGRLQDLDIEVETEPGRRGGVRLKRGALLPALRFTDDEAVVLALGLKGAEGLGNPNLAAAAGSAFRRLEHVLTAQLGERVGAVLASLQLEGASPWSTDAISSATLLQLSEAVGQRQRLSVRYRDIQNRVSYRDFDAYGVVQLVGHWYAAGYCHLRQAVRTFRLDRLDVLEVRKETFTPPPDFDAVETVSQAVASVPAPETVACLLWLQTDMEATRAWLPSYRASLELQDGGVLVHMRAEPKRFKEVALGLLDFDCPVQVIGPPALQEAFSTLADRAAALARGERVARSAPP